MTATAPSIAASAVLPRAKLAMALMHRIGECGGEGRAPGPKHAAANQEIGEQHAIDDKILPPRRNIAGAECFDQADADAARHRQQRRAESADDGADEALDSVADSGIPARQNDR